MNPDQLKPNHWYYCDTLKRDVKFIAIETFGGLEGLAYVEYKDDQGGTVGYYVSVESLTREIQ